MQDNSLLILDDDAPLRNRLRRAMETRGFEVYDAGSVAEGVDVVRKDAASLRDSRHEAGRWQRAQYCGPNCVQNGPNARSSC